MNKSACSAGSRRLDFELLRGFAIFLVIFNHTAANGFFLFANYEPGLRYWLYLLLAVGCKAGVPLFFAISGALLLGRADSDRRLAQRGLRIGAALVLFSLLGYLQLISMGAESGFRVEAFLVRLYDERWIKAYWYLYAYLAFLLAIPLLRVLATHLEDRYFVYLIALAVVLRGIVPVGQYLLFRGEHQLCYFFTDDCWFLNEIVLYPLAGYWMHHRLSDAQARRWLPPLWCAALAGVAVSAAMTRFQAAVTGVCNEDVSQTFFNCFVLLLCMALFLTARLVMAGRTCPRPAEAVILSLGRCSFGVYLIHVLVMRLPCMGALFSWLRACLPPLPMTDVLLYCGVILAASWGATALLRRLPVVKMIL